MKKRKKKTKINTKKKYMAMIAVAVLLAGSITGCSASGSDKTSDRTSGKDSIVKTIVEKVFDKVRLADEEEESGNENNPMENAADNSGEGSKDEIQAEDEETDNISESRILNNGSTTVRFQGNDYYWSYTSDSVESDGIFAYYPYRNDTPNQMVCRHPDGTEEVLFTMPGNGDIYLAGDRMYLKGDLSYSVKLDGSDRIDYGYADWKAVDAAGERVVGYDEQKLFYIDSRTGEKTELADSSGVMFNYYFAAVIDNYLYYSSYDGDSHELTIYQYNLEGTSEVQEMVCMELTGELYDIPGNVIVTQMQRLGNVLYYSFGFYAGTGGFFQTGGIHYIVQDENRNVIGLGALVQEITAEEFLVEDNGDGTVNVYFIDEENGSYIGFWQDSPYSRCSMLNSAAKVVQSSDFRLSRPGAAVYLDGAVCMAEEHQASYTVLIPEPLAAAYGCRDEDLSVASSAVIINDVEVIGNDVYYTVEKSSRNKQRDMGWRPGFTRSSSERYKMTIGGNDAELLYAY